MSCPCDCHDTPAPSPPATLDPGARCKHDLTFGLCARCRMNVDAYTPSPPATGTHSGHCHCNEMPYGHLHYGDGIVSDTLYCISACAAACNAPPPAEPKRIFCTDESEHECVPELHPDRPAAPKAEEAASGARRWTLHRDSRNFFGSSYQLMECDPSKVKCDRDEHVRVIELTPEVEAALEKQEFWKQEFSAELAQARADAAELARLRPFEEAVKRVGQLKTRSHVFGHACYDAAEIANALHPERGAK